MADVDAVEGGGGVRRSGHGKEHLRLLPPSANWYCSKICDWGRSDVFGLLFAYGAKKSVFIYQVASGEDDGGDAASGSSVKVSFFAQLVRGKRDRRVTAVQFLTDTTGELRIVCGGEEGSVQIWDVATLTMIEQHRKHKTEVMAVTVSSLDANFVVAGDRQGRITAWERDAGKVSDFMPISGDGIHSMAMSPHEKALVAVGYRSGVLCLVDAAQGTVSHRLAGHDQEVQCVAWKMTVESCRGHEEDEADTSEADALDPNVWLASASRDKTIKVWRITGREDPTLDQVLRLPTGKQGMSYTQTKQLWLPVAWSLTDNDTPAKHCLWSGSFDGSLFRWEWTADQANAHAKQGKNRRIACKPVVVKGGHNRMLFSIVMVPSRSATPAEDEAVSMLTVSLDRELRLWKDAASSKSSAAAICVEKLTGLGGHAYSVSYNAATDLVAAGVGDQTIRLWNLSSKSTSDYECDLLWKGLQSKVTCVRWHPLQHSLLAYGMEDGRIGVYDIQTKKYKHFRTAHNHEVRDLQWIVLKAKKPADGDSAFLDSIKQLEAAQADGQSLEEALTVQEDQGSKPSNASDVQVLLWSCDTAGRLLESNADAIEQKSREVMANSVAFEWNERCELVAIGRSNGVVEVMEWNGRANDSSPVIYRFHEHLESVSCLAWRSEGTNADLLASGGEDGKIFIYSCEKVDSDQVEGLNGGSEAGNGRLLGSISAHSNKITGLKWCSDAAQGFLASSSADGTVQVWNSTTLEREAHFNHHVGRVLSLDWVSPYTLVTGGEDQTLRLWDYREQQKESSLTQKKAGKVKQPQEFETLTSSAPAPVIKEAKAISGSRNPPTPKKKTQKKSSGVFHPGTRLTPAEIALACCGAAGVQREKNVAAETNGAVDCLLAHRDRASLRGFFASESKRFRDEKDWESLANTLLIQGDITEALRIVAKEGALTPTWLSYAPMAGMDVWREMTNLYAHQLDVQGDKKAAAFHFLSIAKIRSAVSCLASGDAYDEALALIRSRLGPNDPLLRETMWKYAEFLSKRARHGEAALALLNIGSVKAKTRAVHMLVSTGDLDLVRAAVDVLLDEVKSPTETADHDDSDLSFPASFFVSIAGLALAKAQFDVAEAAGQLLRSRLVGTSSSASHRLLGCLLSIVKAVDEHQLSAYKPDEADTEAVANRVADLLESDAPASVSEFFGFLMRPPVGREDADNSDELYKCAIDGYAPTSFQEAKLWKLWMVGRADHFWVEVLRACQGSGYWFNAEGESCIQEAQDLLVGASCFSDIENAVATDPTILLLLQVSQELLRFVIDVMSTSFIGALEHLRESFLRLARSGASTPNADSLRLGVMTLVAPVGFLSLKGLPQCGELGEEQVDSLVLWSSVLLSQCRIVQAASVHNFKAAPSDNVLSLEWLTESILQLLGGFLDDEAALPLSQGLMDAGNQAQVQTLLNELVIANQQGEGTDDSQVRRQASVNAANELRSRLTWGDQTS